MNCQCSPLSPFRWATSREDSCFLSDIRFTGAKSSGKTLNDTATESVERVTVRNGRNPGSISGISNRGDRLIEESEHKARRAARG